MEWAGVDNVHICLDQHLALNNTYQILKLINKYVCWG